MKLRNVLNELGIEAVKLFRENFQRTTSDEVFAERVRCINNIVDAMLDVEIEEKLIEDRLVYYWNMRPSEARGFISREKELKKNGRERRYLW